VSLSKIQRQRKRYLMFLIALLPVLLTACTNHYLTKDMMMQQFFPNVDNRNPSSNTSFVATPIGIEMMVRYDSNRLSKVLCYNEKGDKVYISVNQNTELIVTAKNGETHKFYLDTVFLQNNALHGLRSRILGMERSVSLDAVDKIEIYTELSKETLAEQNNKAQ
jgi:hypothetical protein